MKYNQSSNGAVLGSSTFLASKLFNFGINTFELDGENGFSRVKVFMAPSMSALWKTLAVSNEADDQLSWMFIPANFHLQPGLN
jgi:hypothetical protein